MHGPFENVVNDLVGVGGVAIILELDDPHFAVVIWSQVP